MECLYAKSTHRTVVSSSRDFVRRCAKTICLIWQIACFVRMLVVSYTFHQKISALQHLTHHLHILHFLAVFLPPMQTASTPSTTDNMQSTVDAKILADLDVLKEKMELCEKMLRPGDGSPTPSLKNNDTMLTVIGFLEACAPRMVELVETGAQGGALSESVLMECLQVNDTLQKLLEDVDTYAFTETPASTTAASAPSMEEQLDDILLDNSGASTDLFAPGKTTGDEDPLAISTGKTTEQDDPFANLTTGQNGPFANEIFTPIPSDPMGKTTGDETKPAPKDDFDAFFEERTSNNN